MNEARDNVRYVGALESYWEPLYRCLPEQITDYLSSLMMALRNVYNISRYYNSSDCVASFLVKTTNQLAMACRQYLTENDTKDVFKKDSNVLNGEIQVFFFFIHLN